MLQSVEEEEEAAAAPPPSRPPPPASRGGLHRGSSVGPSTIGRPVVAEPTARRSRRWRVWGRRTAYHALEASGASEERADTQVEGRSRRRGGGVWRLVPVDAPEVPTHYVPDSSDEDEDEEDRNSMCLSCDIQVERNREETQRREGEGRQENEPASSSSTYHTVFGRLSSRDFDAATIDGPPPPLPPPSTPDVRPAGAGGLRAAARWVWRRMAASQSAASAAPQEVELPATTGQRDLEAAQTDTATVAAQPAVAVNGDEPGRSRNPLEALRRLRAYVVERLERAREIEAQEAAQAAPDITQAGASDDPSCQQLLLLLGLLGGPLPFFLGSLLFCITHPALKRKRKWGLANVVLAIVSVAYIAIAGHTAMDLPERVRYFPPRDHISRPLYKAAISALWHEESQSRWRRVPRLLWGFDDEVAAAAWSMADVDVQRLGGHQTEDLEEANYRRVYYASPNADGPSLSNTSSIGASDPPAKNSSGWVLGPGLGRWKRWKMRSGADASLMEVKHEDEEHGDSVDLVWTEPMRAAGRLEFRVVFGWGAAPSHTPKHLAVPPALVDFGDSESALRDVDIPSGFVGAGLRCVPRFVDPSIALGLEEAPTASHDSSHGNSSFPDGNSRWTFAWRLESGWNFCEWRQEVQLPAVVPLNAVSMAFPEAEGVSNTTEGRQLEGQREKDEELGAFTDVEKYQGVEWICRAALVDTTTTKTLKDADARPHVSRRRPQQQQQVVPSGWVMLSTVEVRPLPL